MKAGQKADHQRLIALAFLKVFLPVTVSTDGNQCLLVVRTSGTTHFAGTQ